MADEDSSSSEASAASGTSEDRASEGDEEETPRIPLGRAIFLLASSTLDAATPATRNRTIADATSAVREERESRLALGSRIGPDAVEACSSPRAYRRVAILLADALSVSSSEDGGDDGDGSGCLRDLSRLLCRLLVLSGRVALVEECGAALVSRGGARGAMIRSLMATARSEGEGGSVGPALSLSAILLSSGVAGDDLDVIDAAPIRKEMADLLVKCTLSGKEFASASEVALLGPCLGRLTQDVFDDTVAPALGIKLRANPETVFETAEAMISALASSSLSSSAGGALCASAHLEGNTKLLSSGMRQLKSSKAEMRTLASSFLSGLALVSGGALEPSGPLLSLVRSIGEALSGEKAATALSQPDHRAAAYTALKKTGAVLLGRAAPADDGAEAVLGNAVDAALDALSIALPKEKEGAQSDVVDRGFEALVTWMALSKRAGVGPAGSDGYDRAIAYLAKPIVGSAKPGGAAAQSPSFRFRMGSLHISSPGEDFAESVILDMFRSETKLEAGLASIVENSAKKHSAADVVPQVDGLIALFMLLTRAVETSPSLSLPPAAAKALESGSSVRGSGKTSFVYCAAMTDAASSDPIVARILHRTVAIYCKVQFKEVDADAGGKTAKGLVRMMSDGAAVSAAAYALACCLAKPGPRPQRPCSPSSTVGASLKTVLTYSPQGARASDALILSLFDRVNSLSQRDEAAIDAQGTSREAREAFSPLNDADPVLLKLSGQHIAIGRGSANAAHRGFDPNMVRRAATTLANSTTTPDAMARACVLSHAGSTARVTGRKQRTALIGNAMRMLQQAVVPLSKQAGDGGLYVMKGMAEFLVSCSISQKVDAGGDKDADEGKNGAGEVDKGGEKKVGTTAKSKKTKASLLGPDKELGVEKKASVDNEKHSNPETDGTVSGALHESVLSLITTFGGIAGNFDPEYDDPDDEENEPYVFVRELCVQELAPLLSSRMLASIGSIESLTTRDIDLLKSPMRVLFEDTDAAPGEASVEAESKTKNVEKKRPVKNKRAKGDFGAGFEEEEWERQMKRELAEKKKKEEAVAKTKGGTFAKRALTPEERERLVSQDKERWRLCNVMFVDFPRILATVKTLCLSEIEVGNSCLPTLSTCVISAAVSNCEALQAVAGLKEKAFDTLCALSGCVYEIDEVHSMTLARALTICYRRDGDKKTESGSTLLPAVLNVSTLPSPCAPAASVCFEMDDLGDCLSGPSFAFLFPILQAALTGPRTIAGCECALELVHRHTPMLAGDGADGIVQALRKEMAACVLEVLSHDRSQTFVRPTATEALVACYVMDNDAPKLGAKDLAPLLDERGALGGKTCRAASMVALGSIGKVHQRLVKSNPLVENRIWLNCFEKSEDVRAAARRAWRIANGEDESDAGLDLSPPSKIFAVTLLPLLNHKDKSISSAAADAFAHAMGLHHDTVEKNILRICGVYIESLPASSDEDSMVMAMPAAPVKASMAPPMAKKSAKISTGLSTKKPKKSVVPSVGKLTGTGITKKKKTGKTLKNIAALAPKPKERTVDAEMLQSQFKIGKSKKSSEEKDSEIKIETRLGVLSAITSLTDATANVSMELPVLKVLTAFLLSYGLADINESVRGSARNTARDVVAAFGAADDAISFLLPHFEAVLTTGKADVSCLGRLNADKVIQDVRASDLRKEGVVVALGSVALHLKGEENYNKIDGTIDMLLSALKTPSEEVQASVALCLSKLMKKGRTQERLGNILTDQLRECLHGDKLASRRGAAYGLSAVVKGSGIASLKKFEIVRQLEVACTSGQPESKEGALFAIQLLSSRLGLLFEPYVIVLLPSLLKSFSDSNDYVRTAASHAAELIMSKLSAHGVKLVMPAVLTSFDDPSWRTKQASIHMLGAMGHCAPKQLASCLPKAVPKLTEAFSDTHPKVRSSAEEALSEISKVIRNPEISSISPILLKALVDPAAGTLRALETLIETEFLHAIDAPSLSLIVPVLHRGLRDRAATTKRYGALIAGNICTMINDPRDFVPYLPTLIPDLKTVLLDPIPDVRSTSAKALGALTRGLGEATFPDLRPWLLDTLKGQKGSSVERSGAAQGLTEVLIASGSMVVESVLMDEILSLRGHPQASTREGVLWVLTFLPPALGQGYAPFIDASLPALLSGLADESEPVREVALRAGRVLVRSQGKSHINKILPTLETGLSDDDYRIRVSSLTLLGDLLSMLGGTKVIKGDGDTQDDIRQAERAQAQIALVLGSETRRRVLARVYLARCDTVSAVRQLAVQVWKTIVSVTPRTLREILDVLVDQIVQALASGHPEQTEVAGRCLGDIVGKLGDSVLPAIIPVLRDNLYRGDVHTRRGVCIGLTEVISCSNKQNIDKYLNILVKAVQDALCDEDDGVREIAASCFQSLYSLVGNRAMDEVVPVLLIAMESGGSDESAKARALNGLTGILSIKSRELLPYLIPRLLQRPITKSHADALGSIATVTGSTLHMHFSSIIPALISELAGFFETVVDEEEKEREESIRDCAREVFGNVQEAGVNWLVSEISSKCGNDKEGIRKESCWMLQAVVEERHEEADFYAQIPIMYRELLYRLNDESPQVLKASNIALGALSKKVPAEELVNHIEFIRNLIASMVSDSRRRKGGVGDGEFLLPGFNMPKGLEPLLPIYQRGILYGNFAIREVAAAGLGELIAITSSKYLAGPFIIKMTGPLLRIVGDRNPSEVKIAIIRTLGLILTKGGPALRAFVPQFQTTFVKALSDPARQVRIDAIKALALLMPLSTRLDPLIKELVSSSLGKGSSPAGDGAGAVVVQTATLDALSVVLKHGGKKAKVPESIPSALEAGKELLGHEDEGIRECAAKVIGEACGLLGVATATDVVNEVVINSTKKDSNEQKHGQACACRRILASHVGSELDEKLYSKVTSLVKSLMKHDKLSVRTAACVAVGAIIGSASDTAACLSNVESSILKCMNPKEIMEVNQSIAQGLSVAVRMKPGVFRDEKGLAIMEGALKLAMSGSQRVQIAFHHFLWLALDVEAGDTGMNEYASLANFDSVRTMRTLYGKVLVRIKKIVEYD